MSQSAQPGKQLAITGMDAAWGGCKDLDGFERLVYDAAAYQPGSQTGDGSHALFTPSLLEQCIIRAASDAGLALSSQPAGRQAALILAADQAGSEQVSDILSDWNGPVHDLSDHAQPLVGALQLAEQFFASGQASAVVFAAASSGKMASQPGQEGQPAGFGFDRAVHALQAGSGAGAVVWMPLETAASSGQRIYAVIRSLASRASTKSSPLEGDAVVPPALEDLKACCREALENAGVSSDEIGYLEAFACGLDAVDGIEIAGLVQTYRGPMQSLGTALGSAQANTGFLGPAAGLAGLVRAALCLYHREIPGAPGWSGPKLPALWRNSPFYVPTESRAWFAKAGGPGRLAALNLIGTGGSCAHLVLSEFSGQPVRPNRVLSQGGFYLIPLVGNGLADLEIGLARLQKELAAVKDLNELAGNYYEFSLAAGETAYGMALVGHTPEELLREVELALKALPDIFAKNGEWQTPMGSFCTADPAGRLGGVSMVYPGAFNSYPGVGKDIFRLFPGLHQRTDLLTTDLGNVLRERMLYPRSLNPVSKDEMAALETNLLADPIAMLITGTALSVMYTHLLRETFKIAPVAAFGYSLGENSMMYATGVWMTHGDEAAGRLEQSHAFRTRLAGPQDAIRDFWKLPKGQPEPDQPIWSNYLVMAAPEKVQAALAGEPLVTMTHVNTPRQVVIGGDPQACQRVLAALRASSLKAPFDYALHCEVIASEYAELSRLHSYPVENQVDLKLYSASDYGLVGLDQAEIAHKMAFMLTSPLDFPRLVRKVYEDGARVFIEAGAGSNCARWIDEILKGSPHLAISMNRRGTDDYHTTIRLLARLFSHRVPMSLESLYIGSQPEATEVNL